MRACDVSDPADMSAAELVRRFARLELSPVEALQAVERRIARLNPTVNALAALNPAARADARASESRWVAGRPVGILDGVPCTVKDVLDIAGMPTRHGSLATADAPAAEDAPSVANLRLSGAVIFAKTTTTEFAWGSSGRNPATGATRNPWNSAYGSGGSSCGAGAAAAACFGPIHIGTDAGGSIRVPAAWCGAVGLKPTPGLVPVWPAGDSFNLSTVGPITRTVGDAALALSALAGFDARDPFSLPCASFRWEDGVDGAVSGLRIALVRNPGFPADLSEEYEATLTEAARLLQASGASVEAADPGFPDIRRFFGNGWKLSLRTLVRSQPDASRVDPELQALITAYEDTSGAELLAMERERLAVAHSMARFHRRYDLILCPAVPRQPPLADAPVEDHDTVFWGHWATWTAIFNVTRQPAVTVPVGLDGQGLPISVQLAAAQHRDDLLLRAARTLERQVPALRCPGAEEPARKEPAA